MKKNFLLSILSSFILFSCSPTKNATEKDNIVSADEPKTEISENTTSQNSKPAVHTVAFYNVENLFDTEDDPNTYDEAFTPTGKQKWTTKRYQDKIEKLAKVISTIGDEDGAEIIGVCEVENEKVVKDLVNNPLLKKHGYKYVHYDSPDERGIDVALLYKESVFEVTSSKNYEAKLADNDKTRDVLLVSGKLEGEEINFIVNHWSSRGGGEEKSRPKRMVSALVARQIVDDLEAKNPNAKIILMGDFNDEPFNKSLTEGLQAVDSKDLKGKELFNAFYSLQKEGKGTYNYKGDWNMLDQMIISNGLLTNTTKGFHYLDGNIFDKDFLKEASGKYKGNPFRTFVGTKYLGGTSDHFPIYVHLERK
ncbi:putative extracellular nuclease [Bernardetia litoralis DSM 6794]|uniref:Putative extracellular nuclease n=1 Tax=Bernardetia litoralis (strain ATCC 23117 / DSM 6794 / NBRC 15988 / NCIMB 1366 / Fx l1 / Sio-4) TaxID=880071 RepID=I4AHV2_BERLS|nr:extracellular nuclease [Bernardetia litoralis]AFM03537.1 putative extracellular nuclease [Bernardetia litoralis DSM 6794]